MNLESYEFYRTENGVLYCGDCLEILPMLTDKVDLVLTDPPYGTTDCEWDTVVNLELLWKLLYNILGGFCIMTSSQPFTSTLINSNIKNYRYGWIWDKGLSGNIFLSNIQPMKIHEDICIFYNGIFNPIKTTQKTRKIRNNGMESSAFGSFTKYDGGISSTLNPKSILYFPNTNRKTIQHPTQKPVELMEYMIKTYSNSNNLVLDPFIGSGTTAVACEKLNRRWIGIEISEQYCGVAKERIQAENSQIKLDL